MITRELEEEVSIPDEPEEVEFPAVEGKDYKVVEFANQPMPICLVCGKEYNAANKLDVFQLHMWGMHGLQFRLTSDGSPYKLPEKPVIVEVKPEPVVYPNGSDSPRFGYME